MYVPTYIHILRNTLQNIVTQDREEIVILILSFTESNREYCFRVSIFKFINSIRIDYKYVINIESWFDLDTYNGTITIIFLRNNYYSLLSIYRAHDQSSTDIFQICIMNILMT